VNREEKATAIAEIHERLQAASLAVMTEYRGLSVAQLNRLRRELKQVDASYNVTKNTLARRAIKDTAFEKLEELMRGPTGLVTTAADPVAAAKILAKFAEQNDKLKITGGVLGGTAMPAKGVADLAKLPSREVLLAQLLGLLQAPAAQLLRTIQEPGASLVRLLGAIERSKPAEAAPAAAPAAEEPAAEAQPDAAEPTADSNEGGAE
jgi:large subunit ribosomal protein L10